MLREVQTFELIDRPLPPSSVEALITALKGPSSIVMSDTCIENVVYSSKPCNSAWKVLLLVGEALRRLLCCRSAMYFLRVAFVHVSPALQ